MTSGKALISEYPSYFIYFFKSTNLSSAIEVNATWTLLHVNDMWCQMMEKQLRRVKIRQPNKWMFNSSKYWNQDKEIIQSKRAMPDEASQSRLPKEYTGELPDIIHTTSDKKGRTSRRKKSSEGNKTTDRWVLVITTTTTNIDVHIQIKQCNAPTMCNLDITLWSQWTTM